MVIKRTIDGEERIFVLTSMELFNAYSEQEHIWDVDYVESQLESGLFEEIEDFCVGEADRAEIAEEIASEMRRQINKYDLSQEYAFTEAFHEIRNRRKSGKSQPVSQPVSNSLNETFVKDNLDAILGAQ